LALAAGSHTVGYVSVELKFELQKAHSDECVISQ